MNLENLLEFGMAILAITLGVVAIRRGMGLCDHHLLSRVAYGLLWATILATLGNWIGTPVQLDFLGTVVGLFLGFVLGATLAINRIIRLAILFILYVIRFIGRIVSRFFHWIWRNVPNWVRVTIILALLISALIIIVSAITYIF